MRSVVVVSPICYAKKVDSLVRQFHSARMDNEMNNSGLLAGKTLLLTAAAQGIGRAALEAALANGARVFATDRTLEPLQNLKHDRLEKAAVDGTDAAAVLQHVMTNGPFDGVIHCIGYVHSGAVLECDQDSWTRSFRINVDSFYHVLQAVLPGMIERGGGSIVAISSVASTIKGVPTRAAYSASKAAMLGLVKSVAADYVRKGIRINAVCPGTVDSPSLRERIADLGKTVGGEAEARAQFIARQPMQRLGTPREIAELCVYLCSDLAGFITGQAVVIDGGMTL